MLLPKQHLEHSKLVTDLIHESQYQPIGVDLTLKSVHEFKTAGTIDFDNTERKISETTELNFTNDRIILKQGSYKVIFNEYIKIPSDAGAFCYPRSSLLRCGVTLSCAVWDPGYEGRSEALLIVANEHGITFKKNAKIGQLVFVKLLEATKELYKGKYKGENK